MVKSAGAGALEEEGRDRHDVHISLTYIHTYIYGVQINYVYICKVFIYIYI